jgi:cyclopropane-fatty-acyl-phospholipid synthase
VAEQSYKKQAQKILAIADIKINGKRPYDVTVHNDNLYKAIFGKGSLGVGEAYMDGWWDSKKLDETFTRVFKADLRSKVGNKWQLGMYVARGAVSNLQSGRKAYQNAQAHYDIGNDLYEPMLGRTMAYTCAYWEWGAKDLDQAQTDKFELICRKLGLKKGMRVLDPGCGWGGLSTYMARKYGCEVVCFTPAREQIAYIKVHTKGLKVTAKLSTWQDFRTSQKFDRIASIGMMEHVGPKNYRSYLSRMAGLLTDDGMMLLHTIGNNKSTLRTDPWLDRYIFPGSVLPSVKNISAAAEGLFVMEDWHNMGANYDKTLMSWYANFKKSYPSLDHAKYDERFYRMWEYYLLVCAALFRARDVQLWQIVYSKRGVAGGYKSVR